MKRLAAGLILFLCACANTPSARNTLPAPPPTGGPTSLVGLSSAQLRSTLGAPAFTRREYGAELWRYDTDNCRAFFFLYPSGNDMSVRYIETMPRGQDTAADPACLSALRAKPASPAS